MIGLLHSKLKAIFMHYNIIEYPICNLIAINCFEIELKLLMIKFKQNLTKCDQLYLIKMYKSRKIDVKRRNKCVKLNAMLNNSFELKYA